MKIWRDMESLIYFKLTYPFVQIEAQLDEAWVKFYKDEELIDSQHMGEGVYFIPDAIIGDMYAYRIDPNIITDYDLTPNEMFARIKRVIDHTDFESSMSIVNLSLPDSVDWYDRDIVGNYIDIPVDYYVGRLTNPEAARHANPPGVFIVDSRIIENTAINLYVWSDRTSLSTVNGAGEMKALEKGNSGAFEAVYTEPVKIVEVL